MSQTPNEYLDPDEVEMMLAIEIDAAKAIAAERGTDPDAEIDAALAALAGGA